MSSSKLHRFARHALVTTTRATVPDAAQLASAFNELCEGLRERLQPMFGPAAMAALFGRAHRLAISEFPWLANVVHATDGRCSVEGLETAARDLAPGVIADGLAAVVAHAIGLLSTLIGDDLVMPLVYQAWGTAALGPPRAKTEGNQ
jgi:hypothetical protein